MSFIETRQQIDRLLGEAAILKDDPMPEKMQELIDDMRTNLSKLIEMSEPKNVIHERVCGNREIYIASLETGLAKAKVKAMKAAAKRTKKTVKA
jgi:UDP-N-acetylglucosamine enolpyruvyl transferase